MKLGDIVYDNEHLPDTRGELQIFLAEIVNTLTSDADNTRLSNGDIADALFAAIDLFPPTDANKLKVQTVFDDYATPVY